ncbi:MAG TPA: isoprenyl transferase [Rhodospirillaceae bacterium]|nr:MAG: di-trans,poly-cis-decaprenylcistransferase [Alphaproteobacteria bacterium GWF2_58_20]HAU28485.1 isoprenyl transferase [Rhodospirillaceae bacterium]
MLPMPKHVAIIMDGNGRWAQARGLPRLMGHRKGVETVRDIIRAAREIGLANLTIFAFSSENWKRPEDEISGLMDMLRKFLDSDVDNFVKNNIRLRMIGSRNGVAPDLDEKIQRAETKTAACDGLTLAIAFNYGSRSEIVAAAQKIAEDVVSGNLSIKAIDEKAIADRLWTAGMPDPDLLIRTSGEQRISNFLLYQIAYAEIVFTPVPWPDFTKEHLMSAIEDFRSRERRFGGVSANREGTPK